MNPNQYMAQTVNLFVWRGKSFVQLIHPVMAAVITVAVAATLKAMMMMMMTMIIIIILTF